jgi:hypothetical protein
MHRETPNQPERHSTAHDGTTAKHGSSAQAAAALHGADAPAAHGTAAHDTDAHDTAAAAAERGTAQRNVPATATRRTIHPPQRRRRLFGQKMLIASAIIATGLVVGTGFAVQASVSSAAQAAATQRTQQALTDTVTKSAVVANAQNTLSRAERVVRSAQAKVDTTNLSTSVASLGDYGRLDPQTVKNLTVQTEFESQNVQAAADEADRVAAEAAAAAAAKAAADAAAAAQAAAEALAAGNTVDGAKSTAANLASSQYGWGSDQFSCLVSLWQKESGWSYEASNSDSGAAGIPQALPGSKMSSIASDWETNATTQITWGLKYIASSYGTPCSAWSHSQSVNWY